MTAKQPGWFGPRDPDQPHLNIGYADGAVVNCTTHDMGDCPYHEPPGDGPTEAPTLTDAEKLAALGTYIKVLVEAEKALRAAVTADMGVRRVEKVGAYLPDGTRMASVSRSDGKKGVQYDKDAALKWCERNYPDEVVTVRMVRESFMKKLLDVAGSLPVGSAGLDPHTGEILDFIEVTQGNPYVSITTTAEGRDRMAALAGGFVATLEGPK